jgi:hypothetical protein
MASIPFMLPLVALGVAFLISNDIEKNKNKNRNFKENFEVGGAGPADGPAKNSQTFETPAKAAVEYINQDDNSRKYYSLTGEPINLTNFKHENMVPFYGGKIKGQLYGANKAESILDNMVGSGSQVIHKQEQAPLFDPKDNVQWANGTPNNTEFFQSRINQSMAQNNTKPFESIHVGPGLNQGFGTSGSGGYNSGLDARELYMPKNVDDLRVITNPKTEYTLEDHQGPSYSHVQNVGIIGRVEKNRPDTFYAESPEMWFTTVNSEKAPTYRSEQQINETSRNVQLKSYAGNAGPGNRKASYAPKTFKQSTRTNLMTTETGPSVAINKGPENGNGMNKQSYSLYQNNRTTTKSTPTYGSGFATAIGAVVAPIMDVLSFTRRTDYGENVRIYGDAGSTVPHSIQQNVNDKPKVTIKETTLYTPPLGAKQGNHNNKGGYMINKNTVVENQRATTGTTNYFNTGGSDYGAYNNTSAYNQHNNDLKEPTLFSRLNHGNMQLYNEPDFNICIAKSDADRQNPRLWVPTNLPQNTVSKEMITDTRMPQRYAEPDRMQSNLLDAFRQNPYTQSLSSVA